MPKTRYHTGSFYIIFESFSLRKSEQDTMASVIAKAKSPEECASLTDTFCRYENEDRGRLVMKKAIIGIAVAFFSSKCFCRSDCGF